MTDNLRRLLSTLLLIIPLSLVARDPFLIRDSNFQSTSLNPFMEYYEDPSNLLNISDIRSGRFDLEFSDSIELIEKELLTNSTFWIKSQIQNQSKDHQMMIIKLKDPSLYRISMYYTDEEGGIIEQKSGIGIPPSQRNFNGHILYFKLPIHPHSYQDIYFKIQTRNFISVPFVIQSIKAFNDQYFFERIVLGLFYGFLAAIILYNLFYYFITRKLYFLYYILYSLFFGLLTGTFDGVTPEFLYSYVYWSSGYHDIFSIGLTNIFFLAFMLSFLKIRVLAPRFTIFIYGYFILTLIVFAVTAFSPKTGMLLSTFMSLPITFIVIYGGIIALRANLKEAKFFLAGYLTFLVFIILSIFTILKVIPTNFITFHSLHIGYMGNLIILSAGMGYKISWNFEERQKLIEEKNRELEMTVLDRTREISKQNEQLLKVNSELDRFVYSTSHDLKAPLSSLLGLIRVTRMENDESQREEYFDLMEKTILKQSIFINEIVDFSRNSRTDIEPSQINFKALTQEVLESLEFMEECKNVHTEVLIGSNSQFYSDYNRMKVILNNLVSNAIRFASLGINEQVVHININTDEKEAEIIIRDSGPGIKKEHQKKIFNMFYRASITKSGSGLGLYIVKETLDKLKGTIAVESRPEEFTTFTVRIPNFNPN